MQKAIQKTQDTRHTDRAPLHGPFHGQMPLGAAIPVGIVGARGYSGLELARLLLRHPGARLSSCFATSPFRLGDHLPEKAARAVPGRSINDLFPAIAGEGLQVIFLATPVEISLDLAPKLMEVGVHVIDLSGAFRLQQGSEQACATAYREWYGVNHPALGLLKQAEYGLVPWILRKESIGKENAESSDGGFDGRAALANSANPPETPRPRLIANPGCFATAILMGLLPLLKEGLIDPASVVIDAKSGTSGAGRKAEERLLHCEVDGLCLPYRIGRHQHEPEIAQFAQMFSGVEVDPFLTTHLLDVRRGIIAGLYARLDQRLKNVEARDVYAQLEGAYAQAYAEDRLVSFASLDQEGGESLLNLRRVVGSARTHIAFRVVRDRVYVFSLIDNLMKGAASQAVENFNRLIGAPTWWSLEEVEGVL